MEKPNSIEKALLILNELSLKPYASEKALSDRLGISKPTVHRILNILEKNNYVRGTSENGEYAVGYKAYSVGMSYANSMDEYLKSEKL